jgi:flagellar biosynthesis/type III secretory pathway chaperone
MEHTNQPTDTVHVANSAHLHMRAAEGGVKSRTPIKLPDMIAIVARLAQLLAEEVDCLDEMRITDIEALQEEKRRLGRTLELMKREVDRRPELQETFAAEDVEVFHDVSAIFDEVLQENHRKLLVAKEINFRVVQAISDVVKEEAVRHGYNQRGKTGAMRDVAASISLNKTI